MYNEGKRHINWLKKPLRDIWTTFGLDERIPGFYFTLSCFKAEGSIFVRAEALLFLFHFFNQEFTFSKKKIVKTKKHRKHVE
jgi:hypothetical protein